MAYTTIDNPSDYFNTIFYTGNGGTQAITGVGFAPNWVWGKSRSVTEGHSIHDTIRGVRKNILANDAQEEEDIASITAFGSDGFTLGNNAHLNANNSSMVAWNWKAETAFSNDASSTSIGSLDSVGTVNETAGFAIVKYTGNGSSGATIKHGLSTVPTAMFVRQYNAAAGLQVYNVGTGNTKFAGYLNADDAAGTSAGPWNDTTPTSSVFTVGNGGNTNTNNGLHIAYIFSDRQGYSKFGSYTGNGLVDGTFVYTGFRPAFVLYKNATQADDWFLSDNKRLGYNPDNHYLRPSITAVEGDPADRINLFSNGFKLTTADKGANADGDLYTYYAFAQHPFVTSTGVPTTAR